MRMAPIGPSIRHWVELDSDFLMCIGLVSGWSMRQAAAETARYGLGMQPNIILSFAYSAFCRPASYRISHSHVHEFLSNSTSRPGRTARGGFLDSGAGDTVIFGVSEGEGALEASRWVQMMLHYMNHYFLALRKSR